MLGSAWLLAAALTLQSAPSNPPVEAASPAAPAVVEDRPIQDLFQNLGTDVRRLATIDSAWIVAGGVAGALVVKHDDARVSAWAIAQGHSSYTTIGAVLGDGWLQAAGALGTYATGLLTHEPRTIHIGSDLIRAQTLNGLLTRGLKLVAQRDRPSGGPNSLPSGHTSAAFTSASVLQGHFGWRVGLPAYAAAGFVGWSRVRDDHHWLTDAVIGASIGTLVGHSVTRGHLARRWTLIPAKTSGGGAVYLVRR